MGCWLACFKYAVAALICSWGRGREEGRPLTGWKRGRRRRGGPCLPMHQIAMQRRLPAAKAPWAPPSLTGLGASEELNASSRGCSAGSIVMAATRPAGDRPPGVRKVMRGPELAVQASARGAKTGSAPFHSHSNITASHGSSAGLSARFSVAGRLRSPPSSAPEQPGPLGCGLCFQAKVMCGSAACSCGPLRGAPPPVPPLVPPLVPPPATPHPAPLLAPPAAHARGGSLQRQFKRS